MSKSRLLISGAILPLILIMGACSNKDKGGDTEILSPEVANLSVKNVDTRTIEKLLKVEKRSVKTAEAEKALAKMGLDDVGNGAFSWDKKSGKAGNYTYNNLSGTGKDGEEVKIKTLELTGVHMVGESANFDRLDINGMNVIDDDSLVTISRLSLSRPSPKLGASILEAIETVENIKDLQGLDVDVDLDEDDIEFGALLIDTVSVKSDDGEVTLASLGWGEDERTQKGMFLLEDLALTGRDKKTDRPVNVTLKSVSAAGIDMEHIRSLKNEDTQQSLFSPYKNGLEGFSLKNLSMSVDTMTLSAPSITSRADVKGDTITVKQSMAPTTLSFSGAPEDADMSRAWEFLQVAGYDTLEFSGGSTTLMNEKADTMNIQDSFLSLKDGFDLRFSLSGTGLKDVSEKARAQSDNLNPDDLLDSMTLSSLNMSLTDRSIVDRGFKVVAEMQGQKPEDLKKLAKGALMVAGFTMSMQAETKAQGDILSEAINALGDFVEKGGTIDVSLNPDAPLPAGYLSKIDPQKADLEKLGLKITHKK